jgi:hypothetical protein
MRILELGSQRIAAHQQNQSTVQASNGGRKYKLGPEGVNQRVWPYPNASKTLDRPFASLSGRRRVPKLVNANRVPILRLKKPQSPFMSRIIRDTIDTRERRIIRADHLDEQLVVTTDEDTWDSVLFDQFGLEEDHPWSYETRLAIKEIATLQVAATQKRTEFAARMHFIVQQERALAVEETKRIRDGKHKRRKANRLARRGEAKPVIEQDMTLDSAGTTSEDFKLLGKDLEEAIPSQFVPQGMPPQEMVPGDILPQEPIPAVPGISSPDVIVRDNEKFKTKEEIARIRAANALSKTEDGLTSIKAARAKRKEAAAQQKAEKIKRKMESIEYWKQKLGNQPCNTAEAPVRLSPPDLHTRRKPYTVVLDKLRSEATKEITLQQKPRESNLHNKNQSTTQ